MSTDDIHTQRAQVVRLTPEEDHSAVFQPSSEAACRVHY